MIASARTVIGEKGTEEGCKIKDRRVRKTAALRAGGERGEKAGQVRTTQEVEVEEEGVVRERMEMENFDDGGDGGARIRPPHCAQHGLIREVTYANKDNGQPCVNVRFFMHARTHGDTHDTTGTRVVAMVLP